MYEVLNKDTIKSEIPPPLSVSKRGYTPKKVSWQKPLSILYLQVESIFPVAHHEEKVKMPSLCFLCSYVKKRTYLGQNTDVFRSKHEKANDLTS